MASAPQFASEGSERIPRTLEGAIFRPGARVVISPPLASVGTSNGHSQAADVLVLNSTVMNSGLITAIVSFSPAAALGLRAVDVLNRDGTSTAGGILVTAVVTGTSEPLPVRAFGLTRGGACDAQPGAASSARWNGRNARAGLNADAMVAGTGTGTVMGQWVGMEMSSSSLPFRSSADTPNVLVRSTERRLGTSQNFPA